MLNISRWIDMQHGESANTTNSLSAIYRFVDANYIRSLSRHAYIAWCSRHSASSSLSLSYIDADAAAAAGAVWSLPSRRQTTSV